MLLRHRSLFSSNRAKAQACNRDLTILPIGGGSPERFAALASGSVDATVVTSPSEYAAEKQGLRILVSARDLAELVRIPLTGIGATQKKMERDPDEIVRLLRALRTATALLRRGNLSVEGKTENGF